MSSRNNGVVTTRFASALIVLTGACGGNGDSLSQASSGPPGASVSTESGSTSVSNNNSKGPASSTASAGATAMRPVGKSNVTMPGGAAGAPARTPAVTPATTSSTPTDTKAPTMAVAGSTGAGMAGAPATDAGSGGAAGATSGEPSSRTDHGEASCLDGIKKYDADGPFEVETATAGPVNMYIPKVPAGCKVPMVHFSNGTGANCAVYQGMLNRLATNGFIALCYEDPNTGAGTYGLDAFKAALEKYPDLADYKFGSTGHSQGGMAALTTLARTEKEYGDKGLYTGLAMEPASGYGANPAEGWQTLYRGIKSPVAMFAGIPTDTLVSQEWVQEAYDAMDPSNETYFYGRSDANHISTIGRDGNEIILSWFRWKLLGDQAACEYFKAMPMNVQGWSKVASRNEKPCK